MAKSRVYKELSRFEFDIGAPEEINLAEHWRAVVYYLGRQLRSAIRSRLPGSTLPEEREALVGVQNDLITGDRDVRNAVHDGRDQCHHRISISAPVDMLLVFPVTDAPILDDVVPAGIHMFK